jgi:hypothetical protein
VKTLASGDFAVLVYNPNAAGDQLEDDEFSIVTP